MNNQPKNQYLEHQTREFTDSAGGRWCVRIEQGGGRATPGGPPTARLIFKPADDPEGDDIAASGDAGNWDLASYTAARLRTVLAQAQAHASRPPSD